MADDPKGLLKGGAIALVLSGALFIVKLALDLTTGPTPSKGTAIVAWMAQERLPLAFVSEVRETLQSQNSPSPSGGMHAVFLMLAVATLVLSLAMRSTYGRAIASLGIATAVFDVAAAYPWAIGTSLLVLTQIAVAGWFIAVGAKLWLLGAAAAGAS
jgi:hypothetical protein